MDIEIVDIQKKGKDLGDRLSRFVVLINYPFEDVRNFFNKVNHRDKHP